MSQWLYKDYRKCITMGLFRIKNDLAGVRNSLVCVICRGLRANGGGPPSFPLMWS